MAGPGLVGMNKLTREEFARFLAVLDPDRTRAAEKYEILRRKLVKLFDRQQFLHTDELADETIDRLVKKLETDQIQNISLFAYGIARNICFEARRKKSQYISIQDHYKGEELPAGDPDPEMSILTELGQAQTLECLTKCLKNLPREYHELILEYYQGEKQVRIQRRKDLAKKRGITIEALRCEANKVRERLRGCVKRCLSVRRFEKYAPCASSPEKGGAGER